MLQEGQHKKEAVKQNLTREDVEEEMKLTVQDKVTPYHNLTYEQQLDKKAAWLQDEVLKVFSETYYQEIKKGEEIVTDWFRDAYLK